ncbi:tuberculostearic acid methyltransferase UfaA1-like isoform X3 [Gossypium australe]|uniref:Tuberculostearic acid methyltransferase UfaA1-like isoform X3 n=1 Tax=Gossypium australe TaxID=47621 RepID=A0A5B6W0B7_9ROSI|nr:tuberculostearic acid methyltransferase UfaA1-like isoform X3 [Gossypium australe]
MDGGDAILDYATIQILPSQNRYEAYACRGNNVEKLGVGFLQKILTHFPELNNLYTHGSNSNSNAANYKLQPSNNLKSPTWFTLSTFSSSQVRFTSFQAGMIAANGLLGESCNILSNPKHMVPSLMETGARLFVTRFLSYFISTGCVILLEEGGTMFTFEGTSNKCSLKTVIKVHSLHFYWKVMTEADLGLADSYINGDFSFVDKKDGLLNLVMILIANRDLISSNSKLNKKSWFNISKVFLQACLKTKYSYTSS